MLLFFFFLTFSDIFKVWIYFTHIFFINLSLFFYLLPLDHFNKLQNFVFVWIGIILRFEFSCFFFFFLLLFHLCIVYALFTHCLWDPQPLYSEKNIKNRPHGTIYKFKNYFTTVLLVFSFQQNKLYPNGSCIYLDCCYVWLHRKEKRKENYLSLYAFGCKEEKQGNKLFPFLGF